MKKTPLAVAVSAILLPAIVSTALAADINTGRDEPTSTASNHYSGTAIQSLGEQMHGRSDGSGFNDLAQQNIHSTSVPDDTILSQNDTFSGSAQQNINGGAASHAVFNDRAIQGVGYESGGNEIESSTSLHSVFNGLSAQYVGGGSVNLLGETYAWQGLSSDDIFNSSSSQMVTGTGDVLNAQFHDTATQTLYDTASSTGSDFTGHSSQTINEHARSWQDVFTENAKQTVNDKGTAINAEFSGQSQQILNDSAASQGTTFAGNASQQVNDLAISVGGAFSGNTIQNLNGADARSIDEGFYDQSTQNIKGGNSSVAVFNNNANLIMSSGTAEVATFKDSSHFWLAGGTLKNSTLNDNATGFLGGSGTATGTTTLNNNASLHLITGNGASGAETVVLNGSGTSLQVDSPVSSTAGSLFSASFSGSVSASPA